MRTWQRAIRRAGLPVSYSAGFNPHPKMSFASALPVGAISDEEYLDIQFSESLSDTEFTRLRETLPKGMTIVSWRPVPPETPPLMSLVFASAWRLPLSQDEQSAAAEHIRLLLAAETLPVLRQGKKGEKTVDIRPLLLRLEITAAGELSMLLRSGGDGGAKPREVLHLLHLEHGELRLRKTGLYLNVGNCLQSPTDVGLKEKEVLIDAEKNCYQL
jgi:radical SAM-linked protein